MRRARRNAGVRRDTHGSLQQGQASSGRTCWPTQRWTKRLASRHSGRGAAGALVRNGKCLVRVVGNPSRLIARVVAEDREEEVRLDVAYVRRGTRQGARMGMDRRAEGLVQRCLVAPALHTTFSKESVVEDQP